MPLRSPPILLALLYRLRAFAMLPSWPDSTLTRMQLLALLKTFNADLLSHASATHTLERWCGFHGLPAQGRLVARLVRGRDKPIAPEDRQRLKAPADEPLRYRRVQLYCDDRLLSEADNWYVPGRLTAEMNRLLEETDAPFGRVVESLDFHRETLSADLLWTPLAKNSEQKSAAPTGEPPEPGALLEIPRHVLRHRAILYTRSHTPFSALSETYTRAVLELPLTPLT